MSETMDRLRQDNPAVADQLRSWQIARTRANQDGYDWIAFRAHQEGTGAADPGPQEPEEFREYDWTLYHPDKVSAEMNQLLDANPSIRDQMHAWQVARTQHNEDSYNWGACRAHIQELTQVDPGEQEPPEFKAYDWTKYRVN